MGLQFHETEFGRRFFCKQLPDLTNAINRLADAEENKANRENVVKLKDIREVIRKDFCIMCDDGTSITSSSYESCKYDNCSIVEILNGAEIVVKIKTLN